MKRLEIETWSRADLVELISTVLKDEMAIQAPKETRQESYLTRKQVAEMLNVSLPTLDKWIRSGEITAYRPAGQIRIKASEIEAKMDQIPNMKYQRN